MPLESGFVINEKFRVIRLLGAGGLGEVYEVEHLRTRHRRALKVLLPQWRENREIVDRFIREASAAGHIGNPHIIETFDADTLSDGSPYIVMEFLAGQPLNEVLRWEGRLSVPFACEVLVQVCHAIDAAHRVAIVHRDLKPDNLFLIRREGRTFVKVLDFGISKFSSEQTGGLRVTSTEVALGTPLYMAPEQMRHARDVDGRADLYSLGVILYEVLTGAVPYSAPSFAELAGLVLVGGAKRLDAIDVRIPAAIADAVERCIAVDPTRRFESAAQLREVLLAFAHDEAPATLSESAVMNRTLATPSPVRPEEIARTSQRTSRPPAPLEPAPRPVPNSTPPALGSTQASLDALQGTSRRTPVIAVAAVAVALVGAVAFALTRESGSEPVPEPVPVAAQVAAPLPAAAVDTAPVTERPAPIEVPVTPPPSVAVNDRKPLIRQKKPALTAPSGGAKAEPGVTPPPPPPSAEPALTPPPMPAGEAPVSSFDLRLGCQPDVCSIAIDGADQHRETPALLKVLAGKHRVSLTNTRTGEVRVEDLTVTSDGRARVIVDFRK